MSDQRGFTHPVFPASALNALQLTRREYEDLELMQRVRLIAAWDAAIQRHAAALATTAVAELRRAGHMADVARLIDQRAAATAATRAQRLRDEAESLARDSADRAAIRRVRQDLADSKADVKRDDHDTHPQEATAAHAHSDLSTDDAASKPVSTDDYHRLIETGILGEKVELIDGRVMFGEWELAWSPAQRAAAAMLGIRLPDNQRPPS